MARVRYLNGTNIHGCLPNLEMTIYVLNSACGGILCTPLYTTVQESTEEGKDMPDRIVETQMTQEQVEEFEEDWSNLWNPQATLLE